MKTATRRIFSFLASFILVFSVMVPMANAVGLRASNYFASTAIIVTPTGSGNLVLEIDVNATRTMQEVGASKIIVYEQQSNGKYAAVKTFTRDNTSSLITKNDAFAYARVSYHGKVGVNYYALAAFYAKNSRGSETLYDNSKVVTAS